MKSVIIAAVLVAAPAVVAHELDSANPAVEARQIELAKDLPQTTVIRVDRKTGEFSVAFLKDRAPAKPLAGQKFEQAALNAEKTGIPFNARTELDVTSGTVAWFVGWRGPLGGAGVAWGGRPWGGYGGGYRPYYGGAGYGYGGYGYNSGYGGACGYGYATSCYPSYYPTYSYYGYSYAYRPYYTWASGSYDYALCGW